MSISSRAICANVKAETLTLNLPVVAVGLEGGSLFLRVSKSGPLQLLQFFFRLLHL